MVDAAVSSLPDPPRRHSRRPALSNSDALVAAPRSKAVVASRNLVHSAIASSATTSTVCSSASPVAPRRPAPPAERSRPALLPNSAAADAAKRAAAFNGHSYSLGAGKARGVLPAEAAAITPPAPEKKRPSFSGAAVRAKVSDASTHAGTYGSRGVAARPVAFDEAARRASLDVANSLRALSMSSDSESASSAGSQDGGAGSLASRFRARPSPRNIVLSSPARFSRDAMGSRSERFPNQAQATPFMSRTPRFPSPSPSPKTAPEKKKKSVKSLLNGLLLSSPFNRPSLKQPPPAKPAASTPATPSPARSSASATVAGKLQVQSKASSTDCKAEEEHQLRLVHNRLLQWRLANAKADAALSAQTLNAEKHLCGAWITILGMHKSIALKKMQLQLLRNNCKLMAILRGQMVYLEEWYLLENKYENSLPETVEALNATILRLPVSDGAVADFQAVKNAIGSAVDVMQAMRNSMGILLPKLARTNVLVSQLSRIGIQEQVLMSQCRELLSTLALMHVKYSSLQGQRIQMRHPEKDETFLVSSEYSYCSLTEGCSYELGDFRVDGKTRKMTDVYLF